MRALPLHGVGDPLSGRVIATPGIFIGGPPFHAVIQHQIVGGVAHHFIQRRAGIGIVGGDQIVHVSRHIRIGSDIGVAQHVLHRAKILTRRIHVQLADVFHVARRFGDDGLVVETGRLPDGRCPGMPVTGNHDFGHFSVNGVGDHRRGWIHQIRVAIVGQQDHDVAILIIAQIVNVIGDVTTGGNGSRPITLHYLDGTGQRRTHYGGGRGIADDTDLGAVNSDCGGGRKVW